MPLFKSGKDKSKEYFRNVFDNNFHTVVCFALRFTNNDLEVAQDIAQESFIELWRNNKIDDNIEHIKAFLYVTTRNKALNYLKHKKVKENFIRENNNTMESERFYMDQLIEQETIRLVQNAVDKLPEQARKVVRLKLEGLKNKEIAEITGISVETVKYHKTRAFKILKENLKDKVWFIML